MSDPLIDVLIPAYNAAATLRSAVDSIREQTVGNIRIIVVDDGSTDATPAILADMAGQDSRILAVTQTNGGIVEALNNGLKHCTARYLARHDADDLAYPDRFAKEIAYLEANPDCIAVSGGVRHIDGSGALLGTVSIKPSPDLCEPSWIPSREPYLIHPFLMTYTDKLRQVGGFRYAHHAEDTDLYWRLQELGRLHNLQEVLGDFRIHANSITSVSVVNGRVSATCSQLSGLLAARRRAGGVDDWFRSNDIADYNAARSLREIVALASARLDARERAYMEIASAVKLMALASYKPYEPDLEDCRTIRDAIDRHMDLVSAENKPELYRTWAGTAARLFVKGRFREAAALVPLRLYPGVALRVVFRTLAGSTGREMLRRLSGRKVLYK